MSFGGVVISIVVSHVFMLNHATFYSAIEMRLNLECNSITTLWQSNVSMKKPHFSGCTVSDFHCHLCLESL